MVCVSFPFSSFLPSYFLAGHCPQEELVEYLGRGNIYIPIRHMHRQSIASNGYCNDRYQAKLKSAPLLTQSVTTAVRFLGALVFLSAVHIWIVLIHYTDPLRNRRRPLATSGREGRMGEAQSCSDGPDGCLWRVYVLFPNYYASLRT